MFSADIEEDSDGKLFAWASTWHSNERVLPMSKADLLALPAALASFNGFYTTSGKFTLMNPLRNLMVVAAAAPAILAALVWALVRFIRRRRRSHAAAMR
ncbi:MAG TPA: hypothetical protein VHX61_07530 [Rhizomicrobium sp.]|jgi:hypothetical protein|nr:hypothetical protein [Rhizomicrobium sp.]